jgi:hypothetical protein
MRSSKHKDNYIYSCALEYACTKASVKYGEKAEAGAPSDLNIDNGMNFPTDLKNFTSTRMKRCRQHQWYQSTMYQRQKGNQNLQDKSRAKNVCTRKENA